MIQSPFLPKYPELPDEIPIFPLASAVLMPGVQLPLNIFEPRYLNMVADTLAANHLVGMIQPRGSAPFEENPEIHRVGCAGRITSYSETNDGRIVLVLTGVCRFDVTAELHIHRGYRRVTPAWSRFATDFRDDASRLPNRESFLTSLKSYARVQDVEVPWDNIDNISDADLVNLLCAHLPLEPIDKQALLETLELRNRAELLRCLMDMSSMSGAQSVELHH